VSLCVNLLVAGAVASSFWSLRKSGGGSRGDDGGGQFARFARSLPPERREAIRAATTGARATIAPLRQEARAAREDFNRQLAADVFDRQKLAAAHLREIETEAEVRRAVSRVMMDVAATMTAEERRAFAQWREQRTPGRGGRRGGREPEPK
jgi:uncharacterized membrane protein